jgi:hypothetical protein
MNQICQLAGGFGHQKARDRFAGAGSILAMM